MNDELALLARRRGGLLLPPEFARLSAAQRRGLVTVQPGVRVAVTQPVTAALVVEAIQVSVTGHVFAGRTALWIYGVLDLSEPVEVAVPDTRQLVLLPPARVRRLAPSLLVASRVVNGRAVVSLETAVVQTAETLPPADLLEVVEQVLRRRLSTVSRLRRGCRRGVRGSAAMRATLDVVDDGDLEQLKRQVRAALAEVGVTGLESEVQVRSRAGAVAYLDLVHSRTRNAIEIDGWATHSERRRFVADRRRDRWVRRELGIVTTRIAADEVRTSLPRVVDELLPLLGQPRRGRASA